MKKKDVKIADSLEELLGIEKESKGIEKESNKIQSDSGTPSLVANVAPKTNESNTVQSSTDPFDEKNAKDLNLQIIDLSEFKDITDQESLDFKSNRSSNSIDGLKKNNDEEIKPVASSQSFQDHDGSRPGPNPFHLNSVSSVNMVQCPAAINKIPFTRKAFEDVIMVAEAINEISKDRWGPESEKLEVYMYVLCDAKEVESTMPTRISEIYIPYHSAFEASVTVNQKGILDVQTYLQETGKVLLGWAHSHGHYDVYSSSTDEINHQTILNETANYFQDPPFQLKYIYGITVVESGERFGVILTQYPCGHIERKTDDLFDIQGQGYGGVEKRHRYEELKAILEERATVHQPQLTQTPDQVMKELLNELLTNFVRNLSRTKGLLFDKLSLDVEQHFSLIESLIQQYDGLLLDNVEETFTKITTKLLKALQKMQNEV